MLTERAAWPSQDAATYIGPRGPITAKRSTLRSISFFSQPGVVYYQCSIHPVQMRGRVIVD